MDRSRPPRPRHGPRLPERGRCVPSGSGGRQAQTGVFRRRGGLQPDGGCVQWDPPRLVRLPAGRNRRSGTLASGGHVKPFDESGAFRLTADGDGLRRLAVRGAGVTVLSQSLGFAIQMIATVILARLLTPGDFGLVTMVTTFSLLLMNFGLNGFTEAVLQREEIDHALASNLFWINVGLGFLLTIGFAAAGPLLARFYGDLRVAAVAVAMSVTIFFTCLSVQHLALLKRDMRFSVVSANDILARAVSVAVSILLAQMGWGYWALSTLAFVGMGLGAGLTLTGKDLVLLLLGPGWEESGRIFTFFAPGIGIMLLYYTHGWIHLSIGRADRWFRWSVVEFAVTGLLFLLGLPWGPVGIAVAWVVSFWILTIPALWYAGRPARLGIAPVIGAVWKYALASALAGCAAAANVLRLKTRAGVAVRALVYCTRF